MPSSDSLVAPPAVAATQPDAERTQSWGGGFSPGAVALRTAILYQFCVGQVVLDRLAGRSIFIAPLPESLLGTIGLLVGVAGPALTALIAGGACRILTARFGERGGRAVETGLVPLLAVPFLSNLIHSQLGLNWVLQIGAVAIASAYLIRVYPRVPAARGLIVWLFPILLLTPFWFAGRVLMPLWPGDGDAGGNVVSRRPHPVVFIVLDEFSGVTVLDRNRQLNAARVPRLTEFAREATWYRNATSVYPRTDRAVPAMLSGRYPVKDVPPRPEFYPGNMFDRLRETRQFEEVIFEPYTRLSGKPKSLGLRRTWNQMLSDTVYTLWTVWLHDLLPEAQPFPLPQIPNAWYGFSRLGAPDPHRIRGTFHYSWDADRATQVDHFVRCLEPGEKPAIYFLHIALPHAPWLFTPTGRLMAPDEGYRDDPMIGSLGEMAEDWVNDEFVVTQQFQRYLWQIRFVDMQLGRIFDKLKEAGLYDESLIVITGDHGAAFRPSASRRSPEPRNLADILWIPLFIKLPGQSEGAVSDRNVEAIDLWPTVADSLLLPLSHPVDGRSLLRPAVEERPVKRFHNEKKPLFVDALFEERWEALNDFLGLMGEQDDLVPARAFMPRRTLLGRRVAELPVDRQPSPYQLELGRSQKARFDVSPKSATVPCWLSMTVDRSPAEASEMVIAVALNGEIVALARPIRSGQFATVFTVLVDESRLLPDRNEYRFYEVIGPAVGEVRLRPVPAKDGRQQ